MDTKLCRGCREEINAAARKCPRCQAFQSPWMPWLYMLPALIPLIIIVPLTMMPLWRSRSDPSDVQFHDVKDQLTVSNARLKYEEPVLDEGATVHHRRYAWVYCTIKNDSDQPWEDLEFVLEFQNSEGQRLDIDNVSSLGTVQPHSELELRLACELAVDPSEVAKINATVTDAERPYR